MRVREKQVRACVWVPIEPSVRTCVTFVCAPGLGPTKLGVVHMFANWIISSNPNPLIH